ncbi:hypothetical protein Tco_0682984 [Tanacetum coccineum]|uniref:Transmembrane protein n=1 Tax=Tanacetum coccineum TaxID=301880 RepID=A0ABQ4XSQ0_9ASTR
MQSPEVDSATQLDDLIIELLSFLGLLSCNQMWFLDADFSACVIVCSFAAMERCLWVCFSDRFVPAASPSKMMVLREVFSLLILVYFLLIVANAVRGKFLVVVFEGCVGVLGMLKGGGVTGGCDGGVGGGVGGGGLEERWGGVGFGGGGHGRCGMGVLDGIFNSWSRRGGVVWTFGCGCVWGVVGGRGGVQGGMVVMGVWRLWVWGRCEDEGRCVGWVGWYWKGYWMFGRRGRREGRVGGIVGDRILGMFWSGREMGRILLVVLKRWMWLCVGKKWLLDGISVRFGDDGLLWMIVRYT